MIMKAPAKITFMVMADDVARADILLTSERTYYRFATESSIEDGELKAIENFDDIALQIIEESIPGEKETQLSPEIRMQIFVDNRLHVRDATEQTLTRIIDILRPLHPEFEFLGGFCR